MKRPEHCPNGHEKYDRERLRIENFLAITRLVKGTEFENAVPHVNVWQGERVEGKLLGLRADDLQLGFPWFTEMQVLYETVLFILELAHRYGVLLGDRDNRNIFIEASSTLKTGEGVFRDKHGNMRVVQIDFDVVFDLYSLGKNPEWQSLTGPAYGLLHLNGWAGSKAGRLVRRLFAQNLYKNLSLPLVRRTVLEIAEPYEVLPDKYLPPRKNAQEITYAVNRLKLAVRKFCYPGFSSLQPLISYMHNELAELRKQEVEIILTPSDIKKIEASREVIDLL